MTSLVRAHRELALLAIIAFSSCDRDSSTEVEHEAFARLHFTDVTAASGIDIVTTSGNDPSTQIVEVKGGGLALIDFDLDGDRDIFVPNGATLDAPDSGPGARLLRNDGGMRFTDVTEVAGITHRGWSFGVAVGDIDGDHDDDIFIACLGPDVLLRNRGDGTFEDVTEASGLGDPGWGTDAVFGDLDQDGDLDLFVTRYIDFDLDDPPPPARFKGIEVLNGPRGLVPLADIAYENVGNGVFRRYEGPGALGSIEPAYGLNAVLLDVTGDGRLELLVGNDSQANDLYRNVSTDGRGFLFEEMGLRSGLATNLNGYEQATMGIAVADVNDDSLPDFFTSNFSSDMNTLHVSTGSGTYDDRTRQYGLGLVSRPYLGWASGFFDFDHDGDEDLLIFNGHVYPQATLATMDSDYAQPALLMERVGDRFVRVEVAGALAQPHRDRSALFDDLDGDGDIDVVVSELNGPVRLLSNDGALGDWITVELFDERPGVSNGHAVGAKIDFQAEGFNAHRWVLGGGPFQSTWSPIVHAAIPGGPDQVSLRIMWPDGAVHTLDVALNKHVRIRRTEEGIRVE